MVSGHREELMAKTANPALRNSINSIFKGGEREEGDLGFGGAQDANIYEKITGEKVGGKFHDQKIEFEFNRLNKMMKRPQNYNLSDSDLEIVKQLREEILKSKNFK